MIYAPQARAGNSNEISPQSRASGASDSGFQSPRALLIPMAWRAGSRISFPERGMGARGRIGRPEEYWTWRLTGTCDQQAARCDTTKEPGGESGHAPNYEQGRCGVDSLSAARPNINVEKPPTCSPSLCRQQREFGQGSAGKMPDCSSQEATRRAA